MSGKRWLAIGTLTAGFAVSWHPSRAQDAPAPKEDAPVVVQEAPPEPPKKKKDPFFGNHFALYLETRGGPASIDTVQNPVATGAALSTTNTLDFDGNKSGSFTIGWTLPRNRGQYIFDYHGVADGNYELNSTGSELSYQVPGSSSAGPLTFAAPWWHVTVQDGVLHTTKTPPVWNAATDDANGNTLPDFNELQFPTTDVDLTARVPEDLGNRIQTFDLAYRRDFGGLKIGARWKAGLRYFLYEGTIVTPSWLKGTPDPADFGFADGVVNRFILMDQSTNGYGPMGSGEVHFNFFRQRLSLYAAVEAAFLIQSLETDSGAFTYFARDPGAPSGASLPFPGAGHIHRQVSKTGWNSTFEAGVRVRVLQGFHVSLAWNKTGYLDSILIPVSIAIPANAAEAPLGTSARFVSRDWIVTTINLGLSFQF